MRANPCIKANALTVNYEKLWSDAGFPEVIDYLQLAIEPAINTYSCLLTIPFDKHKFGLLLLSMISTLQKTMRNIRIPHTSSYSKKDIFELQVT